MERSSLRRVIGNLAAGGPELLRTLEGDAALTNNASAKEGISEMGILFRLLDVYRVTPYVSHAPLIH